MDFANNIVLKENYTFFVSNTGGQVDGGEQGLFNRDTRFLSRYQWQFSKPFQTLMSHSPRPDQFEAHLAWIEGPSQVIGLRRILQLDEVSLHETMTIENTSLTAQEIDVELHYASDFCDLFEARGWHQLQRSEVSQRERVEDVILEYTSQDNLYFATTLKFSPEPQAFEADCVKFKFTLAPKEQRTLECRITLHNPLEPGLAVTVDYSDWSQRIKVELNAALHQRVLTQSLTDLRALLLRTEQGLMPAAGIPWFVAAFGRDSLLTAYMMLPYFPEVAEGTLRYLASKQGRRHQEFYAEAPGKILHEVRFGELSRINKVPFSTYYGSVDATLLFILLLHRLFKTTSNLQIVRDLQPSWEAALLWTQQHGDYDNDGFIEFKGSEPGKGLTVQSWKDSHDSLSHASGDLATGNIAVSEVQGYAYCAYLAVAEFYDLLKQNLLAQVYLQKAAALKTMFHSAFWLEDLQTYALALDGQKRPLKVQNSDAGHLLWTGIVSDTVAPHLVNTLMSDTMWSGWGIRTLGKHEVRYNPVSYHNGSVWPHDTALAAAGMLQYGFKEEASKICTALFDLAASQRDYRLPELVAGYDRTDSPPVPYPVACRPQAWDAAALLYLVGLNLHTSVVR